MDLIRLWGLLMHLAEINFYKLMRIWMDILQSILEWIMGILGICGCGDHTRDCEKF